jgi:hypothetical protein
VPAGTALETDGVNADRGWLRVLFEGAPGWISQQVVRPDAAIEGLPVIDAAKQSPMQAFYFSTGTGEPSCSEAPPSVLVVQGPEKVAVDITANGADIRIASTIALRLLDGNRMQLIVISGEATVDGVVVPRGFTMTVELSEDGKGVAGPWGDFRPLNESELAFLQPLENIPVELLHYAIIIPDLADIEAILARLNAGRGGGEGGNGEGQQDTAGGATGGTGGGGVCAGFGPTSPMGSLPYEMVTFYWNPAAGATQYVWNLYHEGGGLLSSYTTSDTNVTLDVTADGIGAGTLFYWDVIAYSGSSVLCTSSRVSVVRQNPPIPPPAGTQEP